MNQFRNISALLGDIPKKHILRQMAVLDRCEAFMVYIDQLFGRCTEAITSLNLSNERRTRLISKLLDSAAFYCILPEVETLVFLHERLLSPVPEPMAPAVGPDFRISHDTFSGFVEVRSLGGERADRDFNILADYIFQKMQKTPNRYLVIFDVSDVLPFSRLLKKACVAAQRFLRRLESGGVAEGTLYISGDGESLGFENGDFVLHEQDFANPDQLRLQERIQQCPIRISYQLTEGEPGNHTLTTGGWAWVGSTDRIRAALSSKLRQLPRNQRNILILDWSYSSLGEHDFLGALYGRSYLTYEFGHAPREGRRRDGFFSQTTRVQAVVALNRNLSARIEPSWIVFPTDNLQSHQRMTLEELGFFAQVRQDLAHPAA